MLYLISSGLWIETERKEMNALCIMIFSLRAGLICEGLNKIL